MKIILLIFSNIPFLHQVMSTSVKMDYLPIGDVRTDPVINPTCLSDHVHTFYGVNELRPETTYSDMRAATGNSGNVAENKSLYWHPTVYELDPTSGIHRKAPIYFGSAYYIWTTGQATAFPDGFKMVAGFNGDPLSRANAECVGPSPCERDDCSTYDTSFFPNTACAELEVSMAFPTCWDGVNLDSADHMSHVSYDTEGGYFDADCPSSHPVKLPEIQLFFRIVPYSGGQHVFADGTSYYHADYFSGWDSNELQTVLDQCVNESEAANPDAWCEDFLTFRDAPKTFGEDEAIVQKLQVFQPPPYDTTTITDEIIDNTSNLPRGACTGNLIPIVGSPTASPLAPPTSSPNTPQTAAPSGTTTDTPTQSPVSGSCVDSSLKFLVNGKFRTCGWVAQKNTSKRCAKAQGRVESHCPSTCGVCEEYECSDASKRFKLTNGALKSCVWVARTNTSTRCAKTGVSLTCRETCPNTMCGDD